LSGNDKGIHIQTHRWEGFFNQAVEMGPGKDWFRHSKVNKGDTQTNRQQRDLISLLYFFKIVKVGQKYLCASLIKHHAMKTYDGVEVQLHVFLTSALDGGEWLALRPCRFTPGERARGTNWRGSWVGAKE
jgi:hypothetical protein